MSVDVFRFHDLREFLAATYAARKAGARSFSFRSFSRRIGVKSPNHLKRVIDGERRLTAEMAPRYAAGLGLKGEAADYFCDLARFSQASTAAEKASAWRSMTHSKRYRDAHALELKHAAYCSNWYIPAVCELACRPDFVADPAWIAPRMLPPIERSEAKQALAVLFELGFLVRTAEGACRQGEPVLSTGPETRGMHIRNYHRAMLERAAESMELVPNTQRDISSLTMCVSDRTLQQMKSRIQEFRKELIGIAQQDEGPERVVQFNFQLFPLSKKVP